MIKQPKLEVGEHDLGENHSVRFSHVSHSMHLNPNFEHLRAMMKEQPITGAVISHACVPEVGTVETKIDFTTELTLALGRKGQHDVESWDPLTVTQEVQAICRCDDHGYIRDGRWVKA